MATTAQGVSTLKGKLLESSAGYRNHRDQAEEYRAARDDLIRKALKQGMTHSEIAEFTGLTRGRIGQFAQKLPGAKPKPNWMATKDVACPKCGAAVGERCVGKTATSFHIERHHAWQAKFMD